MIKKLTKKKKVEILEHLKEVLVFENVFMCNEVCSKKFKLESTFILERDLYELFKEAPSEVLKYEGVKNGGNFINKAWFSNGESNKEDIDGWNYRKQAVDNALKTLGK